MNRLPRQNVSRNNSKSLTFQSFAKTEGQGFLYEDKYLRNTKYPLTRGMKSTIIIINNDTIIKYDIGDETCRLKI